MSELKSINDLQYLWEVCYSDWNFEDFLIALGQSKWRPIESAPKDMVILLAHNVFQYAEMDIGYWNKSKGCFLDIKSGLRINAKYWQYAPRHPDEGKNEQDI